MRQYLCCSVRRMISVGWAVMTSSIRSPRTTSCEGLGGQAGGHEAWQRLLDRARLWTAVRIALIGTAAPHAVVLLGDVREVEEVREAPRDRHRGVGRHRAQLAGQRLEPIVGVGRRRGATVSRAPAPARRARTAHALLGAQRLAQQSAEEPHVVPKRLVRVFVHVAIILTFLHGRAARRHSRPSVVVAQGHLIDSKILNTIFDIVIERGGAFEVVEFQIGRTNDEFSRMTLKVSASDPARRSSASSRT